MNSNQPEPSLHVDEQELIAYHLGEPLSPAKQRALHDRLEHDAAFAALSEEVAHTLRVFSADPVPPTDPEAAWQRLRSSLPPVEPQQESRAPHRFFGRTRSGAAKHEVPHVWLFGRGWLAPALAGALALLVLAVALFVHRHRATPTVDSAGMLHLRPPAVTASGEAQHLDRAERWLTAVNHTTDPLDANTRAEGQHLLTENAWYLQAARRRGDLPDAVVLDRLDRVLTTANHPAEAGLQLRLSMNTDGLLFELRILRQNQTALNGDPQ